MRSKIASQKVVVRKIRIGDAKHIKILSEQLGYKLTLSETKNHIQQVIKNKDNSAFTALKEGKVIGWIHGFKAIRIESNPFIEIGGLVVDENTIGEGIGKLLVNKIKEWSTTQNNKNIRVRCSTKRVESHKFYAKLGFRESKEQKIFQLEI